jgi:hypothetical protein
VSKPKHIKVFRFYAVKGVGTRVGYLAVDSGEFKSARSYKDSKNLQIGSNKRVVLLNGRTDAIDFLTELRQRGIAFEVEVREL